MLRKKLNFILPICVASVVIAMLQSVIAPSSKFKAALITSVASAPVILSNYSEQDIFIPGIAHPIGIKISLDLEAQYEIKPYPDCPNFRPPSIWMGPFDPINGSIECAYSLHSSGVSLQPAGLKALTVEAPSIRSVTGEPLKAPALKSSQSVHLEYRLIPDDIHEASYNGKKICLGETRRTTITSHNACLEPPDRSAGGKAIEKSEELEFPHGKLANDGGNLSADWFINSSTSYPLYDLSDQLTLLLREHSKYQNDPQSWKRLFVTKEELLAGGWKECPNRLVLIGTDFSCFCRTE